jgi:SP family general alpha glucoside:H+ symporter-like MFS transporter
MGTDEQEHGSSKMHFVEGSMSIEDARLAAEADYKLSLWQSIKKYPTACAWSVFFSLGTIMTAFDPQLLGNLYATPAFQRDFGYMYNGQYIISAPWQTGLGMGNPLGQGIQSCGVGVDFCG